MDSFERVVRDAKAWHDSRDYDPFCWMDAKYVPDELDERDERGNLANIYAPLRALRGTQKWQKYCKGPWWGQLVHGGDSLTFANDIFSQTGRRRVTKSLDKTLTALVKKYAEIGMSLQHVA